jgi:hypothetical protein
VEEGVKAPPNVEFVKKEVTTPPGFEFVVNKRPGGVVALLVANSR